ncbi:Hypothetical protein NTJ_01258 [Nesidiocoris tenuis]|uniref:Uncharacterized protein n=1 Tax=Nesidiocoris tenuis TaxID=355587 RepID=A0ABN7A839_9HEMI|nr:Hypothetical protein NTJ_01258 [Nesidiocoris tenuis]
MFDGAKGEERVHGEVVFIGTSKRTRSTHVFYQSDVVASAAAGLAQYTALVYKTDGVAREVRVHNPIVIKRNNGAFLQARSFKQSRIQRNSPGKRKNDRKSDPTHRPKKTVIKHRMVGCRNQYR